MNKPLLLFAAVVCAAAIALPSPAWAKKSECKSGEEKVFSIPEIRPEWVDKPHSVIGKTQLFVGLATQNEKLEDGISLAVENANGVIVEALGQVIQKRSQGVLSFESDEVKQSFGSAAAASFIKNKERKSIYYEKWASYKKCEPTYHYNVWVQVAVPKAEFDAEAARAAIYLRDMQRAEQAKAIPPLMPTPDAMQVKSAGVKKDTLTATSFMPKAPRAFTPSPAVAPSYVPPQPAPAYDYYRFHCGSLALYGGYSYIPAFNTEMGQHNSGSVNITMDGEWGITRNFCMGMGMGWTMTEMENGSKGNIVPMFLRFALKGPITSGGGIIAWIGTEVGGAILQNFDIKDAYAYTPEQKTTGAFMAGAAGGIDIRLQGGLYFMLAGSYTPIFYKETVQMFQVRGGIRYYF